MQHAKPLSQLHLLRFNVLGIKMTGRNKLIGCLGSTVNAVLKNKAGISNMTHRCINSTGKTNHKQCLSVVFNITPEIPPIFFYYYNNDHQCTILTTWQNGID